MAKGASVTGNWRWPFFIAQWPWVPSICLYLKPFISNGDVSIWVKNCRGWRKPTNKWINISTLHIILSTEFSFFTWCRNDDGWFEKFLSSLPSQYQPYHCRYTWLIVFDEGNFQKTNKNHFVKYVQQNWHMYNIVFISNHRYKHDSEGRTWHLVNESKCFEQFLIKCRINGFGNFHFAIIYNEQ